MSFLNAASSDWIFRSVRSIFSCVSFPLRNSFAAEISLHPATIRMTGTIRTVMTAITTSVSIAGTSLYCLHCFELPIPYSKENSLSY